MKIPVETKPALWGMAGGAIAAAIVGFSWGGWVTGGKAEAEATQRANAAVVMALAPVCVERFQRATDVSANLAALKKVDSCRNAISSRRAVGRRCQDRSRLSKCRRWPRPARHCLPRHSLCGLVGS